MHLGVLEIELLLDESFSLKDKRRVVKSIKDRLHREHLVSVSEVAGHEHMRFAVIGITVVAPDAARVACVLDSIERKIDRGTEYRPGGRRRAVLSSQSLFRDTLGSDEPEWSEDDRAEFESLGQQAIREATP